MRPALIVLTLSALALPTSAGPEPAAHATAQPVLDLPWRQAGLTERQAAAHLLDRLAFGARPGDLDRVVQMGLSTWLEQQLRGGLPEPELTAQLARLPSLQLSSEQIAERYLGGGMVVRQAERAGVISRDRANAIEQEANDPANGTTSGMSRSERRQTRSQLRAFARAEGFRPLRELYQELVAQKLLRAASSANPLTEVLTDFWFNHFNVSMANPACRQFVTTYERDAIRPHVLGNFRALLGATARHPAMLLYLDNARSVAAEGATTTLEVKLREFGRGRFGRGEFGRGGRGREPGRGRGGFGRGSGNGRGRAPGDSLPEDPELAARRARGLNENYARELLELHTLGVDGGYTQDDVIAVARAFTGWTTFPPGERERLEERADRARRLNIGFVLDGDFVFRADAHDADPKVVLGQRLPAGRGIEDGIQVLDLLAAHPATARHLATKLAIRFVADEPPPALVDRLAKTFERSGGDLRQVVLALVQAPEFWSQDALHRKIKSPFELAVSALKSLDAEVRDPRPLVQWIEQMGQPLYAYQAPTGFPDRATAWVNTGSLLNRMNFGLQLATGRIPGIHFDLLALNDQREPESMREALGTYVPLLLPERDPRATIAQLEPMIQAPDLGQKIERALPAQAPAPLFGADPAETSAMPPGQLKASAGMSAADSGADPPQQPAADQKSRGQGQRGRRGRGSLGSPGLYLTDSFLRPVTPLAQVVGVILGSPEFQRR